MYLMYVDECGDKGMSAGSSNHFILSALVVHESGWTTFLTNACEAKKAAFERHGIDPSLEIHAKDMLGRSSKEYRDVGKVDRLMALREILKFESTQSGLVRSINVVVDKSGKPFGTDVFAMAWDALINRFENTITHANFPIVCPGSTPGYPEHGMLIVDETDYVPLKNTIRRMRHGNRINGRYGKVWENNLRWVIEDAMHKRSNDSVPIQLCDLNAYFVKQMIDPNSTVAKHRARGYARMLEPIMLKQASPKNELGIVML